MTVSLIVYSAAASETFKKYINVNNQNELDNLINQSPWKTNPVAVPRSIGPRRSRGSSANTSRRSQRPVTSTTISNVPVQVSSTSGQQSNTEANHEPSTSEYLDQPFSMDEIHGDIPTDDYDNTGTELVQPPRAINQPRQARRASLARQGRLSSGQGPSLHRQGRLSSIQEDSGSDS